MSEGTGWAFRLRRVLNARMEEMSFRSGVAVVGAALILTGLGIGLSVILGGSHPAKAAPASVVQSPAAAPSSALAAPSPSARPSARPPASSSAMQDAPQNMPVQAAQEAPQPEVSTRTPARKPAPASSSPFPGLRPRPTNPYQPVPGYTPPPPGAPPW